MKALDGGVNRCAFLGSHRQPTYKSVPPNFARFRDTRISSINGDQERRKLSCGDQ